ncbi:MAG: hypothetical protein AAB927_01355 [Patescibacteria group bacterium]
MSELLSVDTLKMLHDMASLAVSHIVRERLGEEHQGRGGYFRAFLLREPRDYKNMVPLYESWLAGSANLDRASLYWVCSIEKPIRLSQNVHLGHVSSFQSRVPDQLYAGAIMFRCVIPELGSERVWVIFSFSGLPEMADEASMVIAAEHMNERGWKVDFDDLKKIIDTSKNSVYEGPLLGA